MVAEHCPKMSKRKEGWTGGKMRIKHGGGRDSTKPTISP